MKLTQKQAIDAYKAVRKLEQQEMDGRCAKVLFDARKALEPHFQFQNEQETKEVELLGAEIGDNGLIVFSDIESQKKYLEKMNEIEQLEIDVGIEKKPFPVDGMKISPESLAALDLIVEIVC